MIFTVSLLEKFWVVREWGLTVSKKKWIKTNDWRLYGPHYLNFDYESKNHF